MTELLTGNEREISEELYFFMHARCIRWGDLVPGTYLYGYFHGHTTQLKFVIGYDFWTKEDVWSGYINNPPRGRSSGYGDSQIYVRVI